MTNAPSKQAGDSAPSVLYDVVDSIATITINDPNKMNAMSAPIRAGLWEAFTRFNGDESARVAILTGAGSEAFTAGADIKEMTGQSMGKIPAGYTPMPGYNIQLDKPWIAAVNGYALGGGVVYTTLADLAVAAEHAMFAVPEPKWGRGAPWSVPLLHQVPKKIWTELVIIGEQITAQRAYEVGLVNEVVPLSELMAATRELARKVVRAAPLTVAASLKMIRLSTEMGGSAATEVAWDIFQSTVYNSADAIEGPRAFLEKREPRWQGK
jgi:enoyl-CoA hydratase